MSSKLNSIVASLVLATGIPACGSDPEAQGSTEAKKGIETAINDSSEISKNAQSFNEQYRRELSAIRTPVDLDKICGNVPRAEVAWTFPKYPSLEKCYRGIIDRKVDVNGVEEDILSSIRNYDDALKMDADHIFISRLGTHSAIASCLEKEEQIATVSIYCPNGEMKTIEFKK